MNSGDTIQIRLERQLQLVHEMVRVGEEIEMACANDGATVEDILSLFHTRTSIFDYLEEAKLPEPITLRDIVEGNSHPELRDLAMHVQSGLTMLLNQNAIMEEQFASFGDKLGKRVAHVQHAMNFETKYHPKKPPFRRGAMLDEKG